MVVAYRLRRGPFDFIELAKRVEYSMATELVSAFGRRAMCARVSQPPLRPEILSLSSRDGQPANFTHSGLSGLSLSRILVRACTQSGLSGLSLSQGFLGVHSVKESGVSGLSLSQILGPYGHMILSPDSQSRFSVQILTSR